MSSHHRAGHCQIRSGQVMPDQVKDSSCQVRSNLGQAMLGQVKISSGQCQVKVKDRSCQVSSG